jgi:hypothetical protein
MRGRSSNPVAGVLLLTLLTASLLSFGSAANADWLVTTDGATVETRGAWEVKGAMVIFTSPNGVLSSLPLSAVNLEASQVHTQKMIEAAGASEAEAPVKRQAVMVITDADVHHVDTSAPSAEDVDEVAEGVATPATAGRAGSSLAVTDWDESYNVDENSVEVTGTLRNAGRNPATSISLSVLLYSDSGTLLGKREARIAKPALNPGESTGFVASFTSGLTFSEARFDIQSRGFQIHESTPEGSDQEIDPEGL